MNYQNKRNGIYTLKNALIIIKNKTGKPRQVKNIEVFLLQEKARIKDQPENHYRMQYESQSKKKERTKIRSDQKKRK